MALPTKEQISQAIEQDGNILDPQLTGYTTVEGLIGPESYSGGFCIVYPLTNGQKKYAFRVWHTEIDGIKDRLKKISNYLHTVSLPYFVEFDFIEKALSVSDDDGNVQEIDAIKMEWVEGLTLVQYIDQVVNDSELSETEKKDRVLSLAERFRAMVKDLHSKSISHGDLQHGNICVLEDGSIKLVDYDSVYVPTFTTEEQITSGMASYQHPLRKTSVLKADKTDDYFSEQVIYLSLLALSEDLNLWEPIDERDENSLLFTENDYEDVNTSNLYNKLKTFVQNRRIQVLLEELSLNLSKSDLTTLRPLEDVIANKYAETPNGIELQVDDILSLLGPIKPKQTYKKQDTQQPVFDEGAARKRYAQN